jgi:hypothetical protein
MFARSTASILFAAAVTSLSACADQAPTAATAQRAARDLCPAGVPAAIAPAADQTLAFALDAVGVQKYACIATATSFKWNFIGPDAQLYHFEGDDDQSIGHHFASAGGPTWQYIDGSFVVGKKVAAATVDKTAIPWLLLVAVDHGAATDGSGDGKMLPITSIQRLSTDAGLAPAFGCDADHVGAEADMPYTATYYHYRTAGDGEPVDQCGG